ncbi:zinc-binding dehydrogenase [Mesoaciditoga lauensis]|uniref:L-erythro-3,5-diaminohexanoate dehydrogenase n=1 Tax=Mesoaciditoga lauensis TaxID=1495039 RepID=UPI00056084CE|nr:zinc-binding dehydrogenase [Mesoaciditoga lauensis]
MMGNKYGTHRVLEPAGVLPQPAWKVNNDMETLYDNEILVDVSMLNIDAASFTQIKDEVGSDEKKIAEKILSIVNERGKMHNPVTGSGGMLIGKVEKIGPALKDHVHVKEGDKIATLVSLSLTPLKIEKIKKVHVDTDQVEVEAKAVIFESGVYAKLPEDMDERLALAVLDVAGAPAQTARLVDPGDTVVIIGASGKSGTLCSYVAKKYAGPTGRVIAVVHSKERAKHLEELGIDDIVEVDATDAVEMERVISELTDGEMAEVTINVVNIPNTEMSSILATCDYGTVYFFSMATSFTKAALGAEGVGKDVNMIIGNGYMTGHAEIALETVRESKKLREVFESLYVN